ncbi:MAG: beta-lactamase family protein [Verrucomicrobiaceae bacterium]|nr:beta-lactamase family protein [Verrucomicrobiaceae bacterium]
MASVVALAGGLPVRATDLSSRLRTATQIIQKQVDSGTLKAAVLEVRCGDVREVSAFGDGIKSDAMFLLGSITKPLTALGLVVLAERRALSFEDYALEYLPELDHGEHRKIKIEHLLVHTSGLPDQLPNNNELRAKHSPLQAFVEGAACVPLLFEPGTSYHYQSMGILLAARIAEKVSGMALPVFLDKEVFAPLGLSRTVLGLGRFAKLDMVPMQTEHAAPEAGAGDPTAKDWDWNSDYWRKLAAPWGGAHSCTGDLHRLLQALMAQKNPILSDESVQRMLQNHTKGLGAHRGIGWMLGNALGHGCSDKAFGHSGSTGTLAWADPETETSFVLLTSLPKNVSGELILKAVSDLISTK